MTIRPATPADAAMLAILSATTLRESFGPPHNPAHLVEEYIESAISESILEDELRDAMSVFFVLETPDQTPAGYAKLRQNTPPRHIIHPNAIEIQRIYLLQSQVGQGQGRLLMDYCLNWAREQEYRAVWLGVWERNERALAFYRKMGFEQFGYHFFQFGSERQRDYWFQKSLTS